MGSPRPKISARRVTQFTQPRRGWLTVSECGPDKLDSGASDVSLPADVFLTLLRTGTVTEDDYVGSGQYRLADGSTVQSDKFFIHELRVGNHSLQHIVASIAKEMIIPRTAIERIIAITARDGIIAAQCRHGVIGGGAHQGIRPIGGHIGIP